MYIPRLLRLVILSRCCHLSLANMCRVGQKVTRFWYLLRATSYRNSVCPSVCPSVWLSVTSSYRTKPGEIETPAFDSVESLVFVTKFRATAWGDYLPTRSSKRGTPRNRYFTAINSSSVKSVADRHRLAAYHNKHCWWASRAYQNRWPWSTLKFKNCRSLVNFRDFRRIFH